MCTRVQTVIQIMSSLNVNEASNAIISFFRRKTSSVLNFFSEDIPDGPEIRPAPPPHLILQKDDSIQEILTHILELKQEVKDEFVAIENYDRANIQPKHTFTQANALINAKHNRYRDIVPYDANIVRLKVKKGNPPSSYVNASLIKFRRLSQQFLAVQAPKSAAFCSFWQMVMEQKVRVIVMVTGLKEGDRTKASQYWPDMDNPDLVLDDGTKLTYLTHSFHGTFYQRHLLVTDTRGNELKVFHLQTNSWADMSAPEDTKILLDLLYKTRELTSKHPGTILVHCSAGVGRTGTLIALYKLVHDFHNTQVKQLDFFNTVITMREQRMEMVQKPLQYFYIMRCLSHYIKGCDLTGYYNKK